MANNCPVCRESNVSYMFHKYDWNSKFDFYQCKTCQHKFVFPSPTAEELNTFYNKDYFVPPHQIRKVQLKGQHAIDYCDKIDSGQIGRAHV